MVQLQHDMIMVYSGFIYGVDRATADKIQRDLNIVAAELNDFL